jgi:hypothetical protein
LSFVVAKIHVANATVENDGDAQAEEHKFADGCSCGTKAGCKNKLQQGTVAATNPDEMLLSVIRSRPV